MQLLNLNKAFQQVTLINTIAGVGTNVSDAKTQFSVWVSEIEETIAAMKEDKILGDDGVADGLADSLFVGLSFAYTVGASFPDTLGAEPIDELPLDIFSRLLKVMKVNCPINDPYIKQYILNKLNLILIVAEKYNIDLEVTFDEVCKANMSKFDTCELDAIVSQQKYDDKGVPTTTRVSEVNGKTYYVQVVTDETYIDDKHYPAGKWLKSHKWTAPSIGLSCILNK